MKVTIVFYALAITLSLIMMFRSELDKKEDYLSTALDLSIMLALFLWDKERIFIFIALLLSLLIIYFILFYFEILRPAKIKDSMGKVMKDKHKNLFRLYISIAFIIIPIIISSPITMLILFSIFISVDRFLFYRKHKSLV